jgi:AcrR family transcriptional regulator
MTTTKLGADAHVGNGAVAVADGRRRRRERNVDAVVASFVDLLAESGARPTAEEIAKHSGVSLRSVFRFFDTLDVLTAEAIARHARHTRQGLGPLPVGGTLVDRTTAIVEARLGLYRAVVALFRVGWARELADPMLAEVLERERRIALEEVASHFGADLDVLPTALRPAAALAVGSTLSLEHVDLLHRIDRSNGEAVAPVLQLAVERLLSPR